MGAVGTESITNGTGVVARSDSLRMLVVLRAVNMDRITEGFLRCALDQGHMVHVALENTKDRVGRATQESLFDVLAREYETFSYGALAPRAELWLHTATRLRRAIDFLRYLEPEFTDAGVLRQRARSRAPWYVRIPAALQLFRIRPLRRLTDRFLRGVERRMPISEQSLALLRDQEPDVLVVSPLVEIGSPQGDHLRAADRLGIPTALLVASWDNLTTKGAIRETPDTTIVWNADQVREAVELHGLPSASVVATGAHSHDHWFTWQPSTAPDEFARKVGLSADRPFLLYVCSSGFIAGGDEVAFVREWFERLQASGDPSLESLNVLVRPHPQNFESWRNADLGEPGRIVVWPRGGIAPTDHQSKNDYFDSLHHAKAVVGINTSALVDSAIVRRPVFTIVLDRFRETQTGTLHFTYLARDGGGGLLNVADSWDDHLDQLGDALRSDAGRRERIDDFLSAFIRPNGLDQAAAPLAVETVSEVARRQKEACVERGPLRWTVGATASLLGRFHLFVQRLHPRVLRRRALRLRRNAQRRRARIERRVTGRERRSVPRTKVSPRDHREALEAKAERAAEKRALIAQRGGEAAPDETEEADETEAPEHEPASSSH